VKLNWIAKSTIVTAFLYPTSLIAIRRSNGVTDSVLVFVMLALMTLLILLLTEHARLNASVNNKLLMPSVSVALFGNVLLSHIMDKPSQPITIFMGIGFTVQLLAVVLVAWREKHKGSPKAPAL
jgi:hypothetical protein